MQHSFALMPLVCSAISGAQIKRMADDVCRVSSVIASLSHRNLHGHGFVLISLDLGFVGLSCLVCVLIC